MSFTWFRPEGPLRTREQIAREVHAVSLARGLDELATVIALMTISTEVGTGTGDNRKWWCPANDRVPATKNFPHDSKSDDNRSSGYFQQQPGPNGEPWWGTPEDMMTLSRAANTFLERLDDGYSAAANSPLMAGQFAQRVQQSAFPDRYAEKWDEAWTVLRRALNETPTTPEVPMPVSGDPVWLEDVLREALGDRLIVEDGWQTRGNGNGENGTDQMGPIWGVMIHHTGNDRETVAGIRDGRPDLAGPLSQCLITPDGKCHLIAVGPCNHAGRGSYPGIPTNMGNTRLIGFECAWPTIRPDGSYDAAQRWPDAQIITMRDASAAVLKRLGYDSAHVIGHKEYAGASQGKWDPGNIDMGWFRGEVQKDLDGFVFPGEHPPVDPAPGPVVPPDYAKETWDQLRIEWPQLGGRTLVDTVAAIGAKLGIEGCYDTKATK
ncbi:N-acetylmuramoyl-L-alanine amidase [Mycolicibacterium fortuitum]|uniref:N-acetylmuramoyl-L-alanine amidase n=1 Tax=Mycolicibacterium fortuitum TaxID=1766 RepID=A0AAE4V818_MYCFO|nr:N-acetylmuramoyl-L-alanine amidase [Mycolicibacterium fortuitum]MDV7194593.1 N-acetylmuramoyl-L-alanine amidase [Mycolicibacterium fortuitum]MDV7203569.1 N-acetylmuramoyl-L-alanine amidase [Mycolicibacterium fortuitum]MDV7228734.1 N-acetylmuramoyl-L-alanine amidase [Mycolicibacterium fortuitum]MDV7261903.1 N-acetylmuramoyl-L-alanine amidase [Mycolicibacterium fortuitum]MDV7286988.1 N-acetylmuramoyl-L-alanine amidase [Mycolicibacterium fortuitum]